MAEDETLSCLRLSLVPDVGAVTARRLVEHFGSAGEALKASERELSCVERVGPKIASAIAKARETPGVEAVLKKLERFGARYVCYADKDYPELLKKLPDRPLGLYMRGNVKISQASVAIVGSRRCSIYGQTVARKFAGALAAEGFCIISGMASGIDTAAHMGALEAGGQTAAVFGCGLDIVYPPENASLYSELCSKGAVISEFPLGRRADKGTFPIRNRIIAGMGIATVVVESDSRGGSMITARITAEYGRDVFAVPGRIDMPTSRGCHDLIRDGATLASSVEDILESLNFSRQGLLNLGSVGAASSGAERREGGGDFSAEPDAAKNLPPDERAVFDILKQGETPLAEELAQSLGMEARKLAAALTMLEIRALARKRQDGRYERSF